jgi:hypothetical protein
MPKQRSEISLDRLLAVCDTFYAQQGYVIWKEVGDALGISRQAVQLRLRAAVEKGDIKPELVEKYQSLASRRAAAREREQKFQKLKRYITYTPENLKWLQEESDRRGAQVTEIVNGLITRERESTK